MKCESCKINNQEITEPIGEGLKPYLLCKACQQRLLRRALRPLELFNLVSIHGHSYYLHDDFYDYETGTATQPEMEVLDIGKFPFPKLEEIEHNLKRLIDYAFVQYYIEEEVIVKLKSHRKEDVLKRLIEKVNYNRSINYQAYEVAAKVLGKSAKKWIKEEWHNRKENERLIFAEALASCLEFEEAFNYISSEIEALNDKFLSDNISALIYFKDERILDWIEKTSPRIKRFNSKWGHLAASSEFNWVRAVKWLNAGRPLSLIALDALNYCTTTEPRLNQSFWMMKLDPKLLDCPNPDILTKTLNEYLSTDNVPRTRNVVNKIIENYINN